MSTPEQKSAAAPRRGRPRQYDPETALARATKSFWRQGLSATSFDALAEATRMSKPSLYGAYGDKRDWYLAAMDRYAERSLAQMREALAVTLPLAKGLQRVYDLALALYFSDAKAPLGCFLIGTATPEAARDAGVRERLGAGLTAFTGAFEARLRAARAAGELTRAADPSLLAEMASAVLFSIALRARAGHTRAALRSFSRKAVALLCAA